LEKEGVRWKWYGLVDSG